MAAIALAYASAFLPGGAPPAAAWLIALATAGVMVAILILGAARGPGVGHPALRFIFAVTFVILAGGFAIALTAPPVRATARFYLGLPGGAASILYLVGLLPLLVLPIAYAWTFEKTTLGESELSEIRRKLRELEQEQRRASAAPEAAP
ncbi:MAG TPA: hypothetical protein VF021_00050 [Longimicrobiales bacterium]